ncbi:MAG: hypothetical protein ACJ8F7_21835 [Gemmataceae bacterium]
MPTYTTCLRALAAVMLLAGSAGAQTPLRLTGPAPGGARSHLSDDWGVLLFGLSNPSDAGVTARVLTYYAGEPGTQYGRDVWVPAHATLRSWFLAGPLPAPPGRNVVELKSRLYDRTAGEHLVRSPDGQALHSELVRYEPRETATAVLLDADISDGSQGPLSPREQARADELRVLVRVLRNRWSYSNRVNALKQRFLPPVPEAFDGIDHFVLASDRIADDLAGLAALRTWLERGGFLWVPLDLVKSETVSSLLGDALDFEVVDRTSLTHIPIQVGPGSSQREEAEPRDVEEPVEFVRVLAPGVRPMYTIDGWPAAFVLEVGRGRLLVTTLGARGWMRPRTARDRAPARPDDPQAVATAPFEYLAGELHSAGDRPPLSPADLRSYVTGQISYSVVGRGPVLLLFGLFFGVLIGAVVILGRKRLLEHVGWLGPALALGVAGLFIGVGEARRGAVPPTVAFVQLVDATPGRDDVQAAGYLAVYQPHSNSATVGAERGGQFELDLAGLEGRVHSRVQTDLDRWHWENLKLPAGVRTGPFRQTIPTPQPVEATVRFGPDGAEGRVASGPFRPLEDAIIATPGRHLVPVRIADDGSFNAGPDDETGSGQLIAGGMLNDRQRARQALYEKLLADPQPRYLAGRPVLLAWTDPVNLHFSFTSQTRTAGSALLTMPLRYEPTPANTRVTIPAAFVEYRRVDNDGRFLRLATESRLPVQNRLRFQLPSVVLPLIVGSARLTIRLYAPAREVIVGGYADGQIVPLRQLASPTGVQQIDIADPRLLRLSDRGTLDLLVDIREARGGGGEVDLWRIEALGLTVRGHTVPKEANAHEPR